MADARDRREDEARRIAAALASGDPITTLDPASERWCEQHVATHFAMLSSVTYSLPVLPPGPLEYTSSPAGAIARAAAAARGPFQLAGWEHVARIERWTRGLRHTRVEALRDATLHARRAFAAWTGAHGEHLAGSPRERLLMIDRALGVTIMHLATLDDTVSPARPLAALIARRVFPLALPGQAMLLYLDACGGDVLHGATAAELAFVHALARDPADAGTRLVYADYLEERGELARAEQVRRADPPSVSVDVPALFEAASWLLPVQ